MIDFKLFIINYCEKIGVLGTFFIGPRGISVAREIQYHYTAKGWFVILLSKLVKKRNHIISVYINIQKYYSSKRQILSESTSLIMNTVNFVCSLYYQDV